MGSTSHAGELTLTREDREDPRHAIRVHRILLRRTARHELLPDAFTSQEALARLVVLALWPRAPAPVDFFGTLGVVDAEQDGVLSFRQALERNFEHTEMVKTPGSDNLAPTRKLVIRARLKTAVPFDPPTFAEAVAKGLGIAKPEHDDRDGVTRFVVGHLGTVHVHHRRGRATTIEIARAEPVNR